MPAIFFALISYMGWGTGVFVEAILARRLRWYSLTLWSFLFSVLVMSFYVPFAIKDLANLTFSLLILILTLAFIGIFSGTVFYYEALRIGNRALVGTIASSFPVVAVLISIIFLKETVSIQQGLAILVIFTGIILSILNFSNLRYNKLVNKATLFALLTMFSWGIYGGFIKIPVSKIGWFWPNYITFLIFPVIYIYIKIKGLRIEKPTENKAFIPLIVSTVLVRIGELSYNFAISQGTVAVVASIAGAYITLFVVLAFLFFKDPITKQQILGIITTLIGIVLLSVFSV